MLKAINTFFSWLFSFLHLPLQLSIAQQLARRHRPPYYLKKESHNQGMHKQQVSLCRIICKKEYFANSQHLYLTNFLPIGFHKDMLSSNSKTRPSVEQSNNGNLRVRFSTPRQKLLFIHPVSVSATTTTTSIPQRRKSPPKCPE